MNNSIMVNTLIAETVNQTVNHTERLTVTNNQNNDNKLCTSIVWLSVHETVNLLGISKVAFHKNRKADKYKTRTVKRRGGEQYEVLLSSLPEHAQTAYWGQHITTSEVIIPTDIETDTEIYSKTPTYNRNKADKYLAVLKASEGLTGNELKTFIKAWNQKHPELKTSYPRILDARKKYASEGISALTAKYGHRAGETVTSDEDYHLFKSIYLTENRPSAQSCWKAVLGMAVQKGADIDSFPSVHAFVRRLEKEMPEQAIYLARHGHSAWYRKYANYINRDYTALKACEAWVSDHAQIDVAVAHNGKYSFPWVTAWIDYKTEMWLGWVLYVGNPNSDRIFQAFYIAAEKYGLPQDIIIDNGKDYRSKDFAGGRKNIRIDIDETKTTAMVAMLDIKPHFALPYNAQTKPIERNFLKIKEGLSRHVVGFRGGNVVERPEKLADEIKHGKIIDFEEFKEVFDFYIREVLCKMPANGKKHQGLSPLQLFTKEFTVKREVSRDALKLFCMRTANPVSIGRNGVRDSELQITYWSEWMSGQKGRFVYIRRDIDNYAEAWVFDAHTDEYIGKAHAGIFDSPALAKTAVDKDTLKKATAAKRADSKIAKQFLKNLTPPTAEEYLFAMAAGADALSKRNDQQQPQQTVSRLTNTPMDMVIRQEKADSETGKYDVSAFASTTHKKRIRLFESDED